jgi:hypothetical protein
MTDFFKCLTGATVKHVQRINNIFKLILHNIFLFPCGYFNFRMPVWPAAAERRNGGCARLLEDDYCAVTDEIVKVFYL